MLLTITKKLFWCRKYECDIWGYCYTDEKVAYIYKNVIEDTPPPPPKFKSKYKFKQRPRKLREILIYKSKLHLLKSRYFTFFLTLWQERRKLYHKRFLRYTYRYDFPVRWRPPKKHNFRFLSIRLTRLFFFYSYDHQFRQMFRASAKKDGILKQII